MGQLFTNNAITTLAAGINATATELTVAPGKGDNFPVVVGGSSDFFVITMEDSAGNREFIRVDVRGAASDTLGSATYPLQRGYWSTTARSWLTGDTVDLRWTAESMQGLLTPEQSIIPGVTGTYDIGSATFRYRDMFLSRNADIEGSLNVLAGVGVVGNITVTGTVDGRDVATDGTKLDGIEAGATADQTNVEIETAYNAQVPAVSQAEAEAGTEVAIRRWSPLRVAQAIAALETDAAPGGAVNQFQFNDGAGGFAGSSSLTNNGGRVSFSLGTVGVNDAFTISATGVTLGATLQISGDPTTGHVIDVTNTGSGSTMRIGGGVAFEITGGWASFESAGVGDGVRWEVGASSYSTIAVNATKDWEFTNDAFGAGDMRFLQNADGKAMRFLVDNSGGSQEELLTLLNGDVISGGVLWSNYGGGFTQEPVMGELLIRENNTSVGNSIGFNLPTTNVEVVREIIWHFTELSTNGTAIPRLTLGDAQGWEEFGYNGGVSNDAGATTAFSDGFLLAQSWAASYQLSGKITLTRMASNKMLCTGITYEETTNTTHFICGWKTTTDDLYIHSLLAGPGPSVSENFDGGTRYGVKYRLNTDLPIS